MKKQKILNFTNYKVYGEANITFWSVSDEEGIVDMTPFYTDSLEVDVLKEYINDGGFGCQRINSAVLDIYENYEGFEEYLTTIEIEL